MGILSSNAQKSLCYFERELVKDVLPEFANSFENESPHEDPEDAFFNHWKNSRYAMVVAWDEREREKANAVFELSTGCPLDDIPHLHGWKEILDAELALGQRHLDKPHERIRWWFWEAILKRWGLTAKHGYKDTRSWDRDVTLRGELLRKLTWEASDRVRHEMNSISMSQVGSPAGLQQIQDVLLETGGLSEELEGWLSAPPFKSLTFQHFRCFEERQCLKDFDRVNIFIGANNAGKSSAMAALCRVSTLHAPSWPKVAHDWSDLEHHEYKKSIDPTSYEPRFLAEDRCEQLDPNGHSYVTYSFQDGTEARFKFFVTPSPGGNVIPTVDGRSWVLSESDGSQRIPDETTVATRLHYAGWHMVYVPTLTGRGADAHHTGERLYTGSNMVKDLAQWTIDAHDLGDNTLERFRELLGDMVGSQDMKIRVDLLADDVCFTYGGETIALSQAGDGLKQLATIAGAICTIQRGYLLLEEPDLGLHPGWQRNLLKVLAKQEQIQTFLTTHSNHFLDKTPPHCAIYRFRLRWTENRRHRVREVDRINTEHLRSILTELKVRFSSVLLVNATLWVEGPRDRECITALLDMYNHHHSEEPDIVLGEHYSFQHSAGSLISSFDALLPRGIAPALICPDSLIIVDADGFQMLDREQMGSSSRWFEHRREKDGTYTTVAWRRTGENWQHIDPWSSPASFPAENDEGLWEDVDDETELPDKLLRHALMLEAFPNTRDSPSGYYPLRVRELENLHSEERLKSYIKERSKNKRGRLNVLDPIEAHHHYIADVLRNAFDKTCGVDCPVLSAETSESRQLTRELKEKNKKRKKRKLKRTEPVTFRPTLNDRYKSQLSDLTWYKNQSPKGSDKDGWPYLGNSLQEFARDLVDFIRRRNAELLS